MFYFYKFLFYYETPKKTKKFKIETLFGDKVQKRILIST